jgi:phosphate starvation-inducible protein PhoH
MTKSTKKNTTKITNQEVTEQDVSSINKVLKTKHRLKCKNVKQKEFANLITEKEIVVSAGPAGVGKAQPLSAKVLTPMGWSTMGELNIDDYVMGSDGQATQITHVHPQGEKDIYRVHFSDGSHTECCDEHLWYTETYNDRNHRVRENGKRVYSPKQGTVKSLNEIKGTLLTNRGDKNHMIPMTKPVNYETIPLVVDPYVMGCLLGDGVLTINRIYFTSADEEIVNEISGKLPETLLITDVPSAKYGFVIKARNKKQGGNSYLNELNDLDLIGKTSHNKSIPNKFLFNSIENRISLLQGLMDTDGYVNKNGTSSFFTSVSLELINGVREIVQSLGGKCLLNSKIPTYTLNEVKLKGSLAYTLTISLPQDINPFRLSRKANLVKPKTRYIPKRYITNIELVGKKEAKCITIDNESQLYLTDEYIVTHNSFVAIAIAIELLQNKSNPYEKLIITTPAVEAEEKHGFLPGSLKEKMEPYVASSIDIIDKIIGKSARVRLEELDIIKVESLAFIRGKTIDDSIVIVEEVQNMSPHQVKTLLTRIGSNSKYVLSGDLDQSDRYKNTTQSGLYDILNRHRNINEIGFFEFKKEDIVRNPIISKILDNYDVVVITTPKDKRPTIKPEYIKPKKKNKLLRRLRIFFKRNFKG